MRIGSLIPLIESKPVQSYQYKNYRPLGDLQLVISGMSRKKIDEIAVVNVDARNNSQFNRGLEELKSINCDTPLSYGGGLTRECLDNFDLDIVERVVISNAIIQKDDDLIKIIHQKFGRQAVVGLLPLQVIDGDVFAFDTRNNFLTRLTNDVDYLYEYCDEIIVVDVKSEGMGSFNFDLLYKSNFLLDRTLICGGCGEFEVVSGRKHGLAGVYIDNKYLHTEKIWSY